MYNRGRFFIAFSFFLGFQGWAHFDNRQVRNMFGTGPILRDLKVRDSDLLLIFVASFEVSLLVQAFWTYSLCKPAWAGVRLPSAECGRSLL
jgi:hypothetical protein